MNRKLRDLLEYLEVSVNPEDQIAIHERYHQALCWEPVDRLPVSFTYPLPEDCPFQPYRHREVFDDPEKMLYNQLVCAFNTSIVCHRDVGDDLPYSIRADFGTCIIASLFGAKIEQVGDNPPWVIPLEEDAFQRVLDCDPLDFTQGWCPRVVKTYEYYRDILSHYPVLNQVVAITLPDLQGPFDNAELLRGSGIFLDLYDRPEIVTAVLQYLARAQVGFARRLKPLLQEKNEGFFHQHAMMMAGHILIRNDSPIMMSAQMYGELIAPHDASVLRELDGGGIHSCGNIDHLAGTYLEVPGITVLDLGQPTMNDLDALYNRARKHKIPLSRVDVPKNQLLTGEVAKRFPTGVVLRHHAASLEVAREVFKKYSVDSCSRN